MTSAPDGTDVQKGPGAGPSAAFCPARRTILLTAIATGVAVGVGGAARADDDTAADEARPQKGDLFVFAEGDNEGKIIQPGDLPLGGPPALAWPMDPKSKVVRKASRLNEVLLVRLAPGELDDKTAPRAADGIVAYSAVCAHAGCAVTGWVKAEEGDKDVFKCFCHNSEYDPRQAAEVVFGPAPRRLAALPLEMADQSVTVAGAFIGKLGPQAG